MDYNKNVQTVIDYIRNDGHGDPDWEFDMNCWSGCIAGATFKALGVPMPNGEEDGITEAGRLLGLSYRRARDLFAGYAAALFVQPAEVASSGHTLMRSVISKDQAVRALMAAALGDPTPWHTVRDADRDVRPIQGEVVSADAATYEVDLSRRPAAMAYRHAEMRVRQMMREPVVRFMPTLLFIDEEIASPQRSAHAHAIEWRECQPSVTA